MITAEIATLPRGKCVVCELVGMTPPPGEPFCTVVVAGSMIFLQMCQTHAGELGTQLTRVCIFDKVES